MLLEVSCSPLVPFALSPSDLFSVLLPLLPLLLSCTKKLGIFAGSNMRHGNERKKRGKSQTWQIFTQRGPDIRLFPSLSSFFDDADGNVAKDGYGGVKTLFFRVRVC